MHEPFAGCYVSHFHPETIMKNIIRKTLNVLEKHLAKPFSQGCLFWGFGVLLCTDILNNKMALSKKIISNKKLISYEGINLKLNWAFSI